MEEFKAKTSRFRHEIDQAEEREKAATKKLAFAIHEADEKEKEVDALRRKIWLRKQEKRLLEDRISDKEKALCDVDKRKENEDRQRKILDELEEEDERKMMKLEVLITQYKTSADYSENKCAECCRKMQNMTRQIEKFRCRLQTADRKGRELEEQNKLVGRNLRKLAIDEEKRGDREEAYENKIRELWQLRRDEEIRYEGAERKSGRLQGELKVLKEKIYEEEEKIDDVKSMFNEAMNGLGRY